MTAEPKIFTKNYLDPGDGIAAATLFAGSGNGSILNIVDRDSQSLWASSGAASDATVVEIFGSFFAGLVQKTIDTLIILNHNLATFTLSYWDGTAWVALSPVSVSVANTIYSFTPVSTTGIRLTMSATRTTNQEKTIGQLMACALTLAVGTDMEADYTQTYRERSKEVVLGDGSVHKMVTRFSPYRTQKYEAKVSFKLLTNAQADALLAIKEAGEPFLWQPESVTKPEEIFLVHWSNPWNRRYSSSYKGSGNDVQMNLREV